MTTRVLIAGIGYRNLRDYSVGPLMVDRLETHRFKGGAEVRVEDLSFGPIAVVQRLEDDLPDRRFDLGIFVAGYPRAPLRAPGALVAYRWDAVLPDDEEIQRAVTEAVTGVIALDNTITVCGHFRALPRTVVVVEIEPLIHEFGDPFSALVEEAFEEAQALIVALAEDPATAEALPVRALGGWLPAGVGER